MRKQRTFNPSPLFGAWSTQRGRTGERWCENTERAGLRFVGYADKLLPRLGHTGWYLDGELPDSWETYRGAVWQLPARDGRAVYVAGYCDPFNTGAALIDFDVVYGERGGAEYDHEQAARDAARRADSMAERDAETEREYRAKWNAARRVEGWKEELCSFRRRHSALIRAIFTGEGDNAIGARLREETRKHVTRCVCDIRETIRDFGEDILGPEFS